MEAGPDPTYSDTKFLFLEYATKGAAFTYLTFDFEFALVAFEDVLDYGKT